MNGKLVSASLASLLLLGVPAFAASVGPTPPGNHAASAQNSDDSNLRQTAVQTVKDARQAMQQAKSDQHFADLLHKAKGVFIVPHLKKGALIAGGQGGSGVLLARRDGHWTDPAFLSIGSISVGPQVGGKSGPVVMVLMSDKALNDFTDSSNFSLNANAGLSIIDYGAKGSAGFGKGDVVVWSGQEGAFIGASISGSDVQADQHEDSVFYNRNDLTTRKILDGQVKSAAADGLVNEISG